MPTFPDQSANKLLGEFLERQKITSGSEQSNVVTQTTVSLGTIYLSASKGLNATAVTRSAAFLLCLLCFQRDKSRFKIIPIRKDNSKGQLIMQIEKVECSLQDAKVIVSLEIKKRHKMRHC